MHGYLCLFALFRAVQHYLWLCSTLYGYLEGCTVWVGPGVGIGTWDRRRLASVAVAWIGQRSPSKRLGAIPAIMSTWHEAGTREFRSFIRLHRNESTISRSSQSCNQRLVQWLRSRWKREGFPMASRTSAFGMHLNLLFLGFQGRRVECWNTVCSFQTNFLQDLTALAFFFYSLFLS